MCPTKLKRVDFMPNFLATKNVGGRGRHTETLGGVEYVNYLDCGDHITVFAYVQTSDF